MSIKCKWQFTNTRHEHIRTHTHTRAGARAPSMWWVDRIVRFYCYGRWCDADDRTDISSANNNYLLFSLALRSVVDVRVGECVRACVCATCNRIDNSLSFSKRSAFSFTLFNFISLRRSSLLRNRISAIDRVCVLLACFSKRVCVASLRLSVEVLAGPDAEIRFSRRLFAMKSGCNEITESITRRWHIFRSLERFFPLLLRHILFEKLTNSASVVCVSVCWGKVGRFARLIRPCVTLSHYNGKNMCE